MRLWKRQRCVYSDIQKEQDGEHSLLRGRRLGRSMSQAMCHVSPWWPEGCHRRHTSHLHLHSTGLVCSFLCLVFTQSLTELWEGEMSTNSLSNHHRHVVYINTGALGLNTVKNQALSTAIFIFYRERDLANAMQLSNIPHTVYTHTLPKQKEKKKYKFYHWVQKIAPPRYDFYVNLSTKRIIWCSLKLVSKAT